MSFIDKLKYHIENINAAQVVILGGGLIVFCALVGTTLLLNYLVQ